MADDAAPDIPPSGEVVKPKRAAATVLDMVRSLGVMAVVIALTLIFVPGLLHPSKSQRFSGVSYSDDALGFKQVSGQPALVPVGLPSSWYANAATLTHKEDEAHLHIGWVTSTSDYAALEESNGAGQAFIDSTLGTDGTKVTGYVQVNGETWARATSAKGEPALVYTTTDGITIVITGSASPTQQLMLAQSLRQP